MKVIDSIVLNQEAGNLSYRLIDINADYTILYFHGVPGSKLDTDIFKPYAERFGFNLLSFDRPGFGKSEFYEYSPDSITLDVTKLLNELGITDYSCIGYSAGAVYMQHLAQYGEVRPRVLVDIAGWLSIKGHNELIKQLSIFDRFAVANLSKNNWAIKYPYYLVMAALDRYGKDNIGFEKTADRLSKLAGKSFSPANDNIRDAICDSFRYALNKSEIGISYALKLIMGGTDVSIKEIRQPYFSWHGTEDSYCPLGFMDYKKEYISDFQIYLKKGENHFSIFKYAEEIIKHIKEEIR
ncbi:MAG: alpha/beta hydrolase [Candidatus Kapaibacteriales bacterium]